jgi:arylsulfatase A-like enzyme
MRPKTIILLAIVVGAGLIVGLILQRLDWSPPSPQPLPAAKPNVLLISLDTLRPDHLGCYGYQKPTSPNLDRFAAQAIRFSNCRSQAPWTLPSHMSLFTSMLPSSNTVDNINKVLPDDIPTVAQLLQDNGYHTAALVNNGQMQAHWGFQRGFKTWREFAVDTREGNCDSITSAALDQMKATQAPFFLFLHYFDTHYPYASPEPYRKQMATTLTRAQTETLCRKHRSPGPDMDRGDLANLVAEYDSCISWLDHELGRLFAAVPPNTLVVVFSDHGEAFKEHGWLMHGATLFEEEIRVPLLIRLPEESPRPAVVDDSVMLLDVAPTILAHCGIRRPVTFQGSDLGPLFKGEKLPPRLIPSESKAVLEGRLTLSVVLYPLKATYSLFDGRFDLYKLPDETKPMAATDQAAAEALFKPLRAWIEGEEYWMVYAVGKGDYEAVIELPKGGFGLYVPVGLDESGGDRLEPHEEGRVLRWHVYPGKAARPKALFLQPADPTAPLRLDFKINGEQPAKMVFLGKEGKHPEALPADVPADLTPVSPLIEKPFSAENPGFYVFRHRSAGSRSRPATVAPLDEETIRRLRSLGYLP